jgi:uncharacterized protein YceK
MRNLGLALLIACLLSGCGFFDTLTNGWEHSRAVAADLERALGSKPFVGFQWQNRALTEVSVVFSEIPEGYSIEEIAGLARGSIEQHFERAPRQVVIMFTLPGA